MTEKRRLSSEPEQPNVLTREVEDKLVITLNRPRCLNALTRSLCENVYNTLKQAEKEKTLIILKGAGDRAFCSGGDLLKMTSAAEQNDLSYNSDIMLYLNASIYLMHTYKIPIVILLSGITFGGGAGLTALAKYRIATETTRFSMPEVKIGFHPNSAATYFFNRSKGKLGYYLALTGDTLVAADVVHAGYATHYCHTTNLEILENELLKCSTEKDIVNTLEKICEKNLPPFSLEPVMRKIDKCFSELTIENIFAKLESDGSIWAEKSINKLNQCSPTSLKVILKQLLIGTDLKLVDCLLMETKLTLNFFNYRDVFEGTRIALKDRDDVPKWFPSSLAQVTEELIGNHFKPMTDRRHEQLFYEIVNNR